MLATAGWLILAGVLVFLAGAAYGVPQVFTTRSPDARLGLLRARARAWRLAQWPYAAGPGLAAAGVTTLGLGWPGRPGWLAAGAGVLLLAGACLWGVVCARRGRRPAEFARGELPSGPWLGYVWLTLAGLAVLGLACLSVTAWVAVVVLVGAALFTVWFVVTGDIPPFVFYLVLGVVGGWVLWAAPGGSA